MKSIRRFVYAATLARFCRLYNVIREAQHPLVLGNPGLVFCKLDKIGKL